MTDYYPELDDDFLDDLEERGWPRYNYEKAVEDGDEEQITLTHPSNWMTEEEAEWLS